MSQASRTKNANPPVAERSEFINAMRNVASSVAVVTTNGTAGQHGATVTAFSSVSADPPTILICLNSGSLIANSVEANQQFCLNLLPAGDNYTSNRFAGVHDSEITDRFDGISFKGEQPCLEGVTSFVCTIVDQVSKGSHKVFFGEVKSILDSGLDPLLYYQGGYHNVGHRVADKEDKQTKP